MAACKKMMNSKFTWGDTVRVLASAPVKFQPGVIGSICGLRVLDTPELAEAAGQPSGTVMCLIELEDGTSFELPENYLAQIDDG